MPPRGPLQGIDERLSRRKPATVARPLAAFVADRKWLAALIEEHAAIDQRPMVTASARSSALGSSGAMSRGMATLEHLKAPKCTNEELPVDHVFQGFSLMVFGMRCTSRSRSAPLSTRRGVAGLGRLRKTRTRSPPPRRAPVRLAQRRQTWTQASLSAITPAPTSLMTARRLPSRQRQCGRT